MRPQRPRAGFTTALLLLGVLLAGCSDATGDVDAQGHNGYDLMTCEGAKALALDIEYQVIAPGTARSRLADLSADLGKASDQEVQRATQALIASFRAGDQRAMRSAIVSLVKSCQM